MITDVIKAAIGPIIDSTTDNDRVPVLLRGLPSNILNDDDYMITGMSRGMCVLCLDFDVGDAHDRQLKTSLFNRNRALVVAMQARLRWCHIEYSKMDKSDTEKFAEFSKIIDPKMLSDLTARTDAMLKDLLVLKNSLY